MGGVHPLAGKSAPRSSLTNIPRLMTAYYAISPEATNPEQMVRFGPAGHRGSSLWGSFNERHVLSVVQAICDLRRDRGIDGPLFLAMDTHALSEAAHVTALEVLAANGIEVMLAKTGEYTPTPVLSFTILDHNQGRSSQLAEGLAFSPSDSPPGHGGLRYLLRHGGQADYEISTAIEVRANEYLRDECRQVKRIRYAKALVASSTHHYDFRGPYVETLPTMVDLDAIRAAGINLGVDPMGGSGIGYWEHIAERYQLQIDIIDGSVDPSFSFMTLDGDGKIRMDCSSPFAIKRLIRLKDRFDVGVATDPGHERYGIVTQTRGLLTPNEYLVVAAWYLCMNRNGWRKDSALARTVVSTSLIDRVAKDLNRPLVEVQVGFKSFVAGLMSGDFAFAGEESAGASFLRMDGSVWTTDRDGIVLGLLAAAITAKTGLDPGEHYRRLTRKYGQPVYERIDRRASADQRDVLRRLQGDQLKTGILGGEPIQRVLTRLHDGEPIGGIKVCTENAWIAIRPSGTENLYKIYAESFNGPEHLKELQRETQQVVRHVFEDADVLDSVSIPPAADDQ